MKSAPIILFVYNRLQHVIRVITALQRNSFAEKSPLFIFSDGAKNEIDIEKVLQCRNYIKTITGFLNITIIEREQNLGLANSIITGVSEILQNYERVIVLEDDIICNEKFLEYMNFYLMAYEENKKIFSITGYNFPGSTMKIPSYYNKKIYLSLRACSWSWATWRDRWQKADWEIKDIEEFKKNKNLQKLYNLSGKDKTEMLIAQSQGKLDSWAIRWDYTHFKQGGFCIYPVKSLVNNIGFDGTGVHCGTDKRNKYVHELKYDDYQEFEFYANIEADKTILKNFAKVYDKSIFGKIGEYFENIAFKYK